MNESDEVARRQPPEQVEQQSKYMQKLQFQANKFAERIKQGKVIKAPFKVVQRCAQAHTDAALGCLCFNGKLLTYSIDGSLKCWQADGKVYSLASYECFDSGILSAHALADHLCVLTVSGQVFIDSVLRLKTGIVACFSWYENQLMICTRQGCVCILSDGVEQVVNANLPVASFADRPTACLLLHDCCYIGFQGGRLQRFTFTSKGFVPCEQLQLHPNIPIISLLSDSRVSAYSATVQQECANAQFIIVSAQRDKSVSIINAQLTKTLQTLFCGELQNNMRIYQNHLVLSLQTKVKFYKLSNFLTSQCVVKSSFDKPLLFCAPIEQNQWFLGNAHGDLELVEVNLGQEEDEPASEQI